MTLRLDRYLNKDILVSIPALFDDGACRPYRLLGTELNGLWLHSEDLIQRVLREDKFAYATATPVIFVPFAQIAAVLIPTKPVPDVPKSSEPEQAPAAERQAKKKK